MGIYIKGMKIPNEGYLALNIFPDGRVACNLDNNSATAISVPPHRRLIDADALVEQRWDADTRCGYVQVVDVGTIEEAPTVIPADETEFDRGVN